MRLKITLTLLAILLGLLTYIFYIDPKNFDEDQEDIRNNIIGDLAIDIDYLSIRNSATDQKITLAKTDQRWLLQEPFEWPANEFAVERILTNLRFLNRITSFETELLSKTGASLADYGLEPPLLQLTFGKGDERHQLGIGKPTEIGNNLYILSLDQERINVVERALLDSLSVDLKELRSNRIFTTAIFKAQSWYIELREGARNLRARFTRTGDNWNFETPIRARANAAAVNTLLNQSLNLEALNIVAPNTTDLTPYGLQNPQYRIAVESSQNREVLEIGKPVADDPSLRYAKREDRDAIIQVHIDFLDLLSNTQTKLRERRILELDAKAATTVSIRRRESSLTLQKLETGGWEVVQRDEQEGVKTTTGDTAIIAELLAWLDNLKAVPETGFVNDAPSAPDLESYGLEVPEFSISITSDALHDSTQTLDAPITETLQIGDRLPNERQQSYLKLAKKDFVYAVYNDIFERITTRPLTYKDRSLINLPETSRIKRIQIHDIAQDQALADFDLTASEPPSEAAAKLASTLRGLAAERYLRYGYGPSARIAGQSKPWAYRLTFTTDATTQGGSEDQTFTLLISELSGGPALVGASPDFDLSFRFNQDFIDAFSDILFDRQPRAAPAEPFSEEPLPKP